MKAETFLVLSLGVTLSCDDGSGSGGGDAGDTDTETASATSVSTTASASTTSGFPTDPCADDYHGNNTPQTALGLELDTSNTAAILLGDGTIAGAPETGDDRLWVCDGESDFFWFEADCASYLGVEVRGLETNPANVYLYDSSSQNTLEPIDSSEGVFTNFFLRPLHRKVDSGMHMIEVRTSAAGPKEYSLTVTVFPTEECS